MTDDTERRLLEAILANYEDEEARAVYADWLDQRGDPRGEYLRLEAQLRRIPQRLAELTGAIDPVWIAQISRRFDVVLGDPGDHKILVIKAIREVTGLGLREAHVACTTASDTEPFVILEEVERGTAEAAARQFAGSDANLQIVPHGMKSLLRFGRRV